MNVGGGGVLLHAVLPGGAWDRDDPWLSAQQPGQRDLVAVLTGPVRKPLPAG
jgi:hypothetical protein